MVPWPPWVQKGAGQEKDGRSPVLPKVQGEGVPSGPQDIAHTLCRLKGARERFPLGGQV